MSATPERGSETGGEVQKKRRFSVTMALDALLSVTFLVLAAYIGFYARSVDGDNGRDLFWFSMLLGAYGIWRGIRSVLRNRRREVDEAH